MPIPASQLMNLFGGLGSALGAGYAGIRDGGAAAVPGLRMAVGDAGNFMQQIQADEERKRQLAAAGQVDALMQGAGMPQGLAQASIGAGINPVGLYGVLKPPVDYTQRAFDLLNMKEAFKQANPPTKEFVPEKPPKVQAGEGDDLSKLFVWTDAEGQTYESPLFNGSAMKAEKQKLRELKAKDPARYADEARRVAMNLVKKYVASTAGQKQVSSLVQPETSGRTWLGMGKIQNAVTSEEAQAAVYTKKLGEVFSGLTDGEAFGDITPTPQAQTTEPSTPSINTKAEYDKLPKGSVYIDTKDGKKYRKP